MLEMKLSNEAPWHLRVLACKVQKQHRLCINCSLGKLCVYVCIYKQPQKRKNIYCLTYTFSYMYDKEWCYEYFFSPGCPALLQHNVLLNQLTSENNTLWYKRQDITSKGKVGTFPWSYVNYSAESFMHPSCTPEHALVSKIPSSFLIPVK